MYVKNRFGNRIVTLRIGIGSLSALRFPPLLFSRKKSPEIKKIALVNKLGVKEESDSLSRCFDLFLFLNVTKESCSMDSSTEKEKSC